MDYPKTWPDLTAVGTGQEAFINGRYKPISDPNYFHFGRDDTHKCSDDLKSGHCMTLPRIFYIDYPIFFSSIWFDIRQDEEKIIVILGQEDRVLDSYELYAGLHYEFDKQGVVLNREWIEPGGDLNFIGPSIGEKVFVLRKAEDESLIMFVAKKGVTILGVPPFIAPWEGATWWRFQKIIYNDSDFHKTAGITLVTDFGYAGKYAEITLNVDGKKPALFPHAAHQAKIECGACHHYIDDVGARVYCSDDTLHEIAKCDTCHNANFGNKKLRKWKNIGHGLCKTCHTKMKADGAPAKCGGCHPMKK